MSRRNYKRADRFFTGDPVENLQKAVGDWVRSRDGTVIVAGGVELMTMPGDKEFTFRVCIKCTGTRPVKKPATIPTSVEELIL